MKHSGHVHLIFQVKEKIQKDIGRKITGTANKIFKCGEALKMKREG